MMITDVSSSTFVSSVAQKERSEKIEVASAANEKMVNLANKEEDLVKSQIEEQAAKQPEDDSAETETRETFTSENLDRIAQRNLKMNAQLSIDSAEEVDDFIYRLVDKTNGEVIRQYPADEILEREKALEQTQARLLDKDA